VKSEQKRKKPINKNRNVKVMSKAPENAENRNKYCKIRLPYLFHLFYTFQVFFLHPTATASFCFLGRAARQAGGGFRHNEN
jgi:hypothetical protein